MKTGRRRRRFGGVAAVLAAAIVLATGACADPAVDRVDAPVVQLVDGTDAAGDVVEVSGLSAGTLEILSRLRPDGWPAVLSVYTEAAAGDPEAPPVLGDHRVEGGRAVFTPRFPFAPGMAYIARYAPPSGGTSSELEFHIEAPAAGGTTHVVAVYPSAEVWPMNQLKMYVHFSAPMRTGRAFDHLRLIDEATGAPVDQPFVTVQEELWDRDRQVLTVLYDPARIKRGLVPNQQAGLPLQAGGAYRLLIDADWRDAEGRPLSAPFERGFGVGDLDRASPHPSGWSIGVPRAGTTEPLTIDFGESMDHGLLQTLIGVRRASAPGSAEGWDTRSHTSAADEVAGRVDVAEAESIWRFYPTSPWTAGGYEIVVPTIMEDLAGNNLKGLFDADVGSTASEFADAETAYFRVSVGGVRR